MAEKETRFKTLVAELKEYVSLNVDYARLTLSEKITLLLTAVSICAIIFMLVSITMFFLSMAVVRWIANSTGIIGAYFIMCGFYMLLLVLAILLRKTLIINPISRFVTKLFFKP